MYSDGLLAVLAVLAVFALLAAWPGSAEDATLPLECFEDDFGLLFLLDMNGMRCDFQPISNVRGANVTQM